MNPPPAGLSTDCRIIEVIDGDTLTVEIVRTVRVRLIDCWSPETRTKDLEEKALGLQAKEALQRIAEGKEARLFVPANDSEKSGDEWSFGRVLGHLWVAGRSLTRAQIESKNASSTKHGKLGK